MSELIRAIKKIYSELTPQDKVQISLNIAAFIVLVLSLGGKGSFWAFLSFTLVSGINAIEVKLSKGTGLWLWITKTVTYSILTAKFAHNMGELKMIYIYMIIISVFSLWASLHLVKKRQVAMFGSIFANLLGGAMYVIAVVKHPTSYGHIDTLFWILNLASYAYLVYEVIKGNKPRVNLILPIYAVVICLIYIVLIALI